MRRRNNLDVTISILQAALGGANKTKVVQKSNLNFEIIKDYLNTLTGSGLLTVDEDGRYSTTEKGVKFIEDYLNLIKPVNYHSTSRVA